MAFRVVDLMITVLPNGSRFVIRGDDDCGCGTSGCHPASECTPSKDCDACTGGGTDEEFWDSVVRDPFDYAILRVRLREALEEVERREREALRRARLKSLEDVELVEEQLTSALSDVRGRKEAIREGRAQGQPRQR